MTGGRIYNGMTAAERDDRRRERLVVAAIELMGTRGAAETTVTAVCRTSGVTTRYFYRHFADRDALLHAAAERVGILLYDVIVATIPTDGATPAELTRAPVRALVELIDHEPGLAQILFVESGTEPVLRRLRGEIMAGLANLILEQARGHLDISESAAQATLLAATVGVGGIFEVLRRRLDGELDLPSDDLITHCAGLLGALGDYAVRQDHPV